MVKPWERRRSHRCLLPPEHYPWVVYPYGSKSNSNQIFCSLSHPHKIYHKSIPELCGVTETVAYSSGWFLLCKGDPYYSLWNPSNSKSIQLPPLPLKPDQVINCCTLSSPPGDPSCMVMLFDKAHRSVIFIRPEAEDMKWTEIPYGQLMRDAGVAGDDDDDDDDRDFLHHCLSCNGKVYALSFSKSNLVTIKVDKDDHLVIEPLPCTRPECRTYTIRLKSFLVESCGEIFYIKIFYAGIEPEFNEVVDVHVFKLDFARMGWSRAKNLMGEAIFFNGDHAISCATLGNGVEGDSVYFVMEEDEGSFYCFNLKDCTLQVNLPCPILPTSWSSPMFLMPRSIIRLSSNEQVETKLCKEKQGTKSSTKIHEEKSSMEETEVATTKFHDLPLHVLKLISDFLNLFDYSMNFRVTSRDCWSAAPPLERKQAFQKLEGSPLSPWLLFPTNHMTVHTFVDPKHAYRFLMTVPETLVTTQLRFSKQGWLMMSDCENSVSLYNPFTKATIDLPSQAPQRFASSYVMGFSSLPASPGCLVVGFEELFHNGIIVMLAVTGQEGWHDIWLDCEFWMNHGCPVFCNGAFYLLGEEGNLLVFEYKEEGFGEENFHWEVLDNTSPCESYQHAYILEWDGMLASVFVGHTGKWVRVFKLNTTTMSWESVESLGNHTFYVSRSSCLAIEAGTMGMQNRIYFPRVHGNSILYYSLETGKFHYDRQGYYMDNFHNTKEQLLAGWFDPRYFVSFY